MSLTIYAIDPDVWQCSNNDPRCHTAIIDVWEHNDKCAVALDGGDVEQEYIDLLTSPGLPIDLRKLLQDIFNQRDRSSQVVTVPVNLAEEVLAQIQRMQCITPVEPVLIGMAAATDFRNVALLLVGTDKRRSRSLHDRKIREIFRDFFRRHFHRKFEVQLASEIGISKRDEAVHGYARRCFEDQTRQVFMERILKKFRNVPHNRSKTPGQVNGYRDSAGKRAGEVDVYLYLDSQRVRYVWIGECELREAGNEGQPTTNEKMQALLRKVEAVRDYERKDTHAEVVISGYLITNATQMSEPARIMAEASELQFVTVAMPRDWTVNYRWHLHDDQVSQFNL